MSLGAFADVFVQISLSVLKILLYSNDISVGYPERPDYSFHIQLLC